eukprot:GHVO01039118.1.p2 GENE.GHVO01039118.1~~GHVO01039118.1.p2  ORF type:complete len:255 (+),score=30.27 GHVO01039118.1:984-1748(+)
MMPRSFLNNLVLLTNRFSEATRDDNAKDLNERQSYTNASYDKDILLNPGSEFFHAAIRVDGVGFGVGRTIRTLQAARHGDLVYPNRALPAPVSVVVDSTALEFYLGLVPGFNDSRVVCIVFEERGIQTIFHKTVNLITKNVRGDTSSDLQDENERQKNSKGHHHTVVLLVRSAATKEADNENDTSDHDEQDGRSTELAPEEVKVFIELGLDQCPSDDKTEAGQEKDKVESKEQVLDALHASLDHLDGLVNRIPR